MITEDLYPWGNLLTGLHVVYMGASIWVPQLEVWVRLLLPNAVRADVAVTVTIEPSGLMPWPCRREDGFSPVTGKRS